MSSDVKILAQVKGAEKPENPKAGSTTLKLLRRLVFLTFGAVLMAVGLEIFLVPNKIIDGGITGISIMVSHITDFPLGIFLTLFNLPFCLWDINISGKTLHYPRCSL